MGKEEFISIPHFINPQLFWYHTVDGQSPAFVELQRIEETVQLQFTAKNSSALCPHRPVVGEIVAIAFVSWNKFIRARVEYIAKYTKTEDQYVVWALDYGFPFQTKQCYVRKLQASYAQITDHIRLGAVANVIPAELDFDFVTTTSRLVSKQQWSQRAVELLEKVINDAASVSFIESFCADGASQKQHFGDLKIINHSGDEFFISDYLIKLNYAVSCTDDFRGKLSTLQTIKIPCWQTNSNDMKIIENKLNTLNVHYAHQGKFELSGTLSESSCDTFSKQKVMDWCERNQNFNNKNDHELEALCPTSTFDATDISFDDSVSVNNLKAVGRRPSTDETIMGFAGTLHESRRRKYEGKGLPPKPALDVFEVIPERKLNSQDEKKSDANKSGDSFISTQSSRARALIELRKKHQELTKEQKDDIVPYDGIENLNLGTQSDSGTLEFLEACKEKNAQSARLEKLKELRKRRVQDVNSNSECTSTTEVVEDNCNPSITSSRLLRLKKIKEKHSKQNVIGLEKPDAPIDMPLSDNNTDVQSQGESRISAHAAKLISLRKKQQMKDSYSQQSQAESNSNDRSVNVLSVPAVQSYRKGYKMPQRSPKFTKLEFTNTSENYINSPLAKSQKMSNLPPKDSNYDGQETSRTSTARDNELSNLRKMINENPFQNMTMVPAGFDVTKLIKRRDEHNHWHTKKTTLNDSLQSNYSAEEYQIGGGSRNSSSKMPISRRTEDVEHQNFRLTRCRKERKKHDAGKSGEKHILDLSLHDFGCPPAITPVIVSPKAPIDLLLFNESEKEDEGSTGEDTITNSCLADLSKIDKLIDLSAASEILEESNGSASSDSFVKFVKEKNTVRDTSREKLLDTSNLTSDGSLDLLSVERPVKAENEKQMAIVKEERSCKDSSSSISSSSFTKLESATQSSPKAASKNPDRSYEASSSSGSSGLMGKTTDVVDQVKVASPIIETVVKSSSSDSTQLSSFENKNAPSPLVKPSFPINSVHKAESSSSSTSSLVKSPSDEANSNLQSLVKMPQSYSTNLSSLVKSPANATYEKNLTNGDVLPSDSLSSVVKSPASIPICSQGIERDRFPLVASRLHSSSSSSSSLVKPYLPVRRTTQILSGSYRSARIATNSTSMCNETTINLPEVAGEASLKTNLIEHLVLAHSNVKVTPIERMTSALFSPEIHQEMEHMRLTKMYRIQSYAWGHLVRGNSFFVVNTSRTGKTWCYLPPLCSMVGFRLESQSLPQTYGPVAVVIAPSSVQVESIVRQCRRLLASTKTRVTIVPSYAFRNAEEVKIELHNGCGILVITPPSLQRLLVANEREALLNMERIQYVVVDDLDTMMSQDEKFDETLHKFIAPVLHHQGNGKVPFQMVVTSKKWSRRIINLLRISNQPLLCIADYLEAAVYAKTKVSIKLQSSAEKMAVVIKCLEKCPYSLERVVIVCSTYDEVDEVEKRLQEAGYSCLAYTDRMAVEYCDVIHEWKVKTICHQILITIDCVLPELMIQNVWTVIHYSLPTSWTKFNFRFSVFLKNYDNSLTNDFKKPTKVPKSLILLDEQNNIQLPRLIEFMKHHNQLKHIHPDILNVSARVTADREESRVNQGILMCPNILEFGSCDQSNRCLHRHQLTKYDTAVEGIPTHGEVRLKILDVLSPTHYTARLLTQKLGQTWEIARRSNEVTHFLMQLTLHFMNDDAQVIHWPQRVNDLCVYKGEGIFHRCRLLEVPTVMYENIVKLVNVKVKLIDTGSSLMCKSHDILVMPEQFKDFPAQAVDIRLSGVVPFDNERVWDSRSTRTVKKWIMTDVTDKDCLQASINFSLIDTIWVNNVILMEKLSTICGHAVKINVRRSLLGKEFAVADDGSYSVKQIALENGLLKVMAKSKQEDSVEKPEEEKNLLDFSTSTVSEVRNDSRSEQRLESVKKPILNITKKPTPKVSNETTEEWMHLKIDELLQVKVEQMHDPSKFYLRLMNNDDDLKELEEMIRNLKKVPLQDPHPMQNCLALHDSKYHRAKIQRLIVDSTEGSVQARVFLCDLGLFSNYPLEELRSSSTVIIEYIPFQAICCKLTGLRVECVGEKIQKIIQTDDSVLFAYAIKEISDADDYDEGFYIRQYEIILYDCFSKKNDIQINKMLVEQGLASFDEETKHFLELETKVDFTDFEYEQGEANESYDFQAFLDRVKKQMDEEDAEEEQMHKSPCKAIKEAEPEEPKIVEISPDSSVEVINIPSPKADSIPPSLRTLHKRPLTTWYETMCMIYLVIHAPDITDYHLEVSPRRLIYVAIVNGEKQMLILDLLGYVEPDQVTHEIRGLNVVIRLVKSVHMEWPRLLQDPRKFPWLTYNFNAIDAMEAELLINRYSRRTNRMAIDSSDEESEASDSNPCETFTPIVNIDELHDPMQDMY